MGNMMKWILIGCLVAVAVALVFGLPLLGIEGYGDWGTWLLLLLVLACVLPMLLMNRKKGDNE
ncbi:hypothetical protein GCM10023188_14910 [Pontibacter saemangeumensis]|uniref:DUF5668 domain-containing protein n=1 Tax=Pontibacter saemangeumensis TaxID=1084525 RepID=A0ABP8LIL7_9BACT